MTHINKIARALLQISLIPFAGIYGIAIIIRNRLYDGGWLTQQKINVPVISVGNITAGGTGKTPFVIALANWLTQLGYSPGIISRGYKRKSRGQQIVKNRGKVLLTPSVAGDEPFLIADQTERTVVITDTDRCAAAETAVNRYGCDILIADDAFQHRRLQRNLDIVLWDIELDPNSCRLLPAGRLREPLKGLRRADLLLISRTTEIPARYHRRFQKVRTVIFIAPLTYGLARIGSLSGNPDFTQEQLSGKTVLTFCGLGNPNQFFDLVASLTKTKPVAKSFPDHYRYTMRDVHWLDHLAKKHNCRYLITTRKDAVNLPAAAQNIADLLVVDIEYIIGEKIKAAILNKLPPRKSI
ncbi:MAG TPA: tetraacyldisaccharide 4'-kinase [Candidatus Marinimicrobia bacterium]|nr:tetraacyldisaccharide 4'-kinase [Candidatus Neomarinimicrobiota bacterium]